MEDKNSKIYLIIFVAIILFAIVLTITKKVNSPIVVPPQNNQDIGIQGNGGDLVFLSVLPKSEVSGLVNLTGEVKGGYFFEGNILVNILDVQKNVLKSGHGAATTDWMTVEPVSFTAIVDFTGLPIGPAYLEIHNDNASGLPENDKSILVPITIE